ncbi:MAG TPA: trypsin-like peptidase domain-containing protein [Solirubrobacterales bacterium]|nr:trypsin-like peptidase domain-containing protein [Solirubrobacterales bacterium]
MTTAKRFIQTPFGAALLGGALVALAFCLALGAGWVKADSSSPEGEIAPLAAPIVDRGSEEGTGNLINQIYRRDGEGVAFISAQLKPKQEISPFGLPEESGGGTATGSGFLIDTDGHIVTNAHVVEGADRIEVKLGASDKEYTAEVVGADPATDVALIKVDAPSDELHPLALGDSSKIEVGDPVIAIGNPFGLDRTVTSGIVSALQRQIEAPNGFSISHVIQTDAAINPGNSGGPLINDQGQVIGINSQIQNTGNDGNVGIGFAVPINTAREVVRQLEEHGEVKHAYLGLSGGSLSPELVSALKLPVKEGVLVSEVVSGGPADQAGIRGGDTSATIEGAELRLGGDIITEINGKKITGMEDVVNLVNEAKPGETMEVKVQRGDTTKTLTVTLGVRPSSVESAESNAR